MDKIDISVIIPVKNGQRYLDLALSAIFSQKINATFEVILIDSGSRDKTIEIAREYPLKLYEIEADSFNHGLTRNYGISKSQGEYLVLTTADAIPYNDIWMEKLVGHLRRDEQVAGAYSRQIPHQDAHPLTQLRVNRFFTASKERRESQAIEKAYFDSMPAFKKYYFCNFDNVSSCIRRSVWEKISFPKTNFAEDLEWSRQVLNAWYKIVYEPESAVYHSHDFSVLGWYKKNLVHYSKLYSLFGLNNADTILKLMTNFVLYTLRDIYYLGKEKKNTKTILSSIPLIPLYAFSAALAQYKSTKGRYCFKDL